MALRICMLPPWAAFASGQGHVSMGIFVLLATSYRYCPEPTCPLLACHTCDNHSHRRQDPADLHHCTRTSTACARPLCIPIHQHIRNNRPRRRQDRPDLRSVILPSLLQLRRRTELYPRDAAPSAPAAPAPGAQGQGDAGPLAMFLCPITQDVMADPVVAADG